VPRHAPIPGTTAQPRSSRKQSKKQDFSSACGVRPDPIMTPFFPTRQHGYQDIWRSHCLWITRSIH
jgi:hypothetical protein